MSGLGLKIRTPQTTNRQKQSEREQVELGKEIVAYTENEHSEYDPLDRLLLLAARHKREMESRSDPSDFIGLTIPHVSPSNPFVRFGTPTVHTVSPLSYHTLTPNTVNEEPSSPVRTIKFGTKRKKRASRAKILPKYLKRRTMKGKFNLIKWINKTMKKTK
jgi:hypothetical protein